MRMFAIAALCCMLAVPAVAQFTITADDYQAAIDDGTDTYQATNTAGERFDLGTFGAADNVYDFTQFNFQKTPRENRYISPAGTMLEDEYPDAMYAKLEQSSGIYSYYKMQEDGFYSIGSAMYVNNDIFYYHPNPVRPIYKFPIGMETEWEYDGVSDFLDLYVGVVSTLTEQVEVVAAGTLITPAGEAPCLVMRRVLNEQFYGPGTSNEYNSVVYVFLGKDGHSAFMAIDTEDYNSKNPRVGYASYTQLAAPTPVDQIAVTGVFELGNVFPNPVRGTANESVTWTASRSAPVTITLFNVHGQQVATVFEGRTEPGTHSAPVQMQGLPQGMYFLRMTTPDCIQTRKVMKLGM